MNKTEVTGNGLVADLFSDNTSLPRKAIIMLGGSEGGKSWSRIKRPIEVLVKKGYCVLSLAYFKSPGLPDSLQEIPLEYFKQAFDWLFDQEGIVKDEVAILGGSKGAEAALLLGSIYPQVKAVIAFSPSSVVWQGIPASRFAIGKEVKSSWTFKGERIPYLAYPYMNKLDLVFMQLRKMHEEGLQNKMWIREASIAVEHIKGAIMLISGKRDRLWPAEPMGDRIIKRLKRMDFDHPYKHLVYDSGHNAVVMNKDCWRNIFAFLEEHFATDSVPAI
jgi:pimeloyl-ACP methyl ester carboxylesterase